MLLLSAVPMSLISIAQSAAFRHVVRDLTLVAAVLAFLVTICRPLDSRLLFSDETVVMALFAAMGGVAAALLAVLVARLSDDPEPRWLSMALGCYSLAAIPTATIGALDIGAPIPAIGAVRLLIHCMIVALLMVALLKPPAPTGWRALSALAAGAGAVAGAGVLGFALPVTTYAVISYQPLQLGVALLGAILALAIAVCAARREAWALWYIALGFVVIGLAHTGRVSATVSPIADLGLGFSTIRLGGVALALWGTLCLAREAMARLDDEQATHEEELRLAEIRLARTAERDHELRNGLAGLAGATTFLRGDRPDVAIMCDVVAAELSRLDDLLRAPIGARRPTRTSTYAVGPVLSGLVALRRSSGMDLDVEADPGLCAVGSSAALAQVITNLIDNAARHAPGSPVRITATSRERRVVIRVRDFGPGVPTGQERAVFEPGVRDDGPDGLGLGLHICRRLLAAENGSIFIRPTDPERPGCAVMVELTAAPGTVRSLPLGPAVAARVACVGS
jgi:two-component system, OmpR family, sensor kinase